MPAPKPDRTPGDDWSLYRLYEIVPDAYELDLLDEWHQNTRFAATFESGAVTALPQDPSITLTQSCFMVERMLGGEVIDGEGY